LGNSGQGGAFRQFGEGLIVRDAGSAGAPIGFSLLTLPEGCAPMLVITGKRCGTTRFTRAWYSLGSPLVFL
jgi:hypothetical protein